MHSETCKNLSLHYTDIVMINAKEKMIQIRVSCTEKQMLKDICNKLGCKTSEFIRGLLREKFIKVFPAYSLSKNSPIGTQEIKLTDEQFCEKWYGKVVKTEAGYKCEQKTGGSILSNMLENRDNIYKNGRMIENFKK